MINKVKKLSCIIVIAILIVITNIRDVSAAGIGRVGDHWEALNGLNQSYNETFNGFKFSNSSNRSTKPSARPWQVIPYSPS